MCRFDELLYALVTAQPYERVQVREGVLSKVSAYDGHRRFPDYHQGQWVAAAGPEANIPPTPMRVLARA